MGTDPEAAMPVRVGRLKPSTDSQRPESTHFVDGPEVDLKRAPAAVIVGSLLESCSAVSDTNCITARAHPHVCDSDRDPEWKRFYAARLSVTSGRCLRPAL